MAKRRKKKARRSTKRSRAAKRAYKRSGLYKYNMRKKRHGGGRKKRRYSSKKRRSGRKSRHRRYGAKRGGFLGAKQRHYARRAASAARKATSALVQSVRARFSAKGYTPKQSSKLAARYVRVLKHKAAKAARGPSRDEQIAAAMSAANRSGQYAN